MPAAAAPGKGGSQPGYRLPHARPAPVAAPKPAAPKPAAPAPIRPRYTPAMGAAKQAQQASQARAHASAPAPKTKIPGLAGPMFSGYTPPSAKGGKRYTEITPAKQAQLQALVRAGAPHPHGGGGLLGLIEGAPLVSGALHLGGDIASGVVHAAPGIGKILGNAGRDLYSLPSGLLQGGEQLATAFAHDTIGNLTGHGAHHQEIPHLLGSMAVNDPIVKSITSGSLAPIAKDPLYALMDVAGAAGAAGRVAGAAARSGALGRDIAEAANTARKARELVPGVAGDVQHYSKNLGAQLLQHKLEQHPRAQDAVYKLTGRSTDRLLKKRVDEHVATSAAREQQAVQDVTTQLRAVKPNGPAADVVPHAVMGLATKTDFAGELEARLHELQQVIAHDDALHAKGGDSLLSPAARKANLMQQSQIHEFLSNPEHEAAIHAAAQDIVSRGLSQDARKAELGLINESQAERRGLEPYAQTHMGARMATKEDRHPLHPVAKAAQRDLNEAKKHLRNVQMNRPKAIAKHGEAERAVAKAQAAVAAADKQAAGATGFARGRYGQTRLRAWQNDLAGQLDARRGLPRAQSTRLAGTDLRTSTSYSALRDLRSNLRDERTARRQAADDAIKQAKADVKAARDQFKAVEKYRKGKRSYLRGMVIDTHNGALPLSTDTIKQYMAAEGHDPTAYVRLATPSEHGTIVPRDLLSRGGSRRPKYTGASIEKGTWSPGYGVLAKTQIANERAIMRAKSVDEFIRQESVGDVNGQHFTTEGAARHAAEEFRAQHGQEMVPVRAMPQALDKATKEQIRNAASPAAAAQLEGRAAWTARRALSGKDDAPGDFVLLPKTQADRFEHHMKVADNVNRVLTGINRQFRNTVLPFSTKWLAGNTIEAGLRAALVGASPKSYMFANRVMKRMGELEGPDATAHLERMATGGLHYGMQHRLNMEQVGAADSMHPIAEAARKVSTPLRAVTQGIFEFNRKIESAAEKAVLGRHMQRQLQEFAGTWAKATVHERRYLDQLAHGYANPRMAADAGRYVHDTLGQYDRFGPRMKQFIRSVAPFAPWYINAAKFIYYTMPVHHPFTNAMLLDTNRVNQEQWAKDHNVPHGTLFGLPTGDLESAVKTGPTDFLNIGRYTPAGAFTSGPSDFALNMLLPQAQGALHALNGQDPFGNDLTGPDGKITDSGQRILIALNDILGGFAGPLNQIHRVVAEHGSTPYNSSTIWRTRLKPATHHGAGGVLGGLNRVFNPFEPTHLGKSYGVPSGQGVPGVSGRVPGVSGGSAVEGRVPKIQ